MDWRKRYQPILLSIEADLLRCTRQENGARGREAWTKLGNAVRQAQEIVLQLKPDLMIEADEFKSEVLKSTC